MPTYAFTEQEQQLMQARHRKNRLLILLLLILLLLLFLFALLAYVFFIAPSVTVKRGKFEFLFSIYGLSRPLASAVDKEGNIYISNNGTSEVFIFDKTGDYKSSISGRKRREKLFANSGLYIEGKKIYVADFTAERVHIFSLQGRSLGYFPKDAHSIKKYGSHGFTPYNIAAYKDKLYITSNDGIYIFSKSGKLLSSWRGRGLEPDKFDFPNGIAIDKRDGTIFVSDVLNRRVKALNNNGSIKWIIGRPEEHGRVKSLFLLPRGIAFDQVRNFLYVVDTFANKIIILDKEGRLISSVGERGVNDAQFNFPEGITLIGGDTFYLADRENNRLQALRLTAFPPPTKKEINKYRKAFVKPEAFNPRRQRLVESAARP